MPETWTYVFFFAFAASAIALRFSKGSREYDIFEVLSDAFYGVIGSVGAIVVAYVASQLGFNLNDFNTVIIVSLVLYIVLNAKAVRKHF